MNFRYPHQQKQRSEHFFFPDLKSKCLGFFWKTAKNLPSKASSLKRKIVGPKRLREGPPFLPSNEGGRSAASRATRRHGSRVEKLRCFTDGFPGPSEQCFRLISHWCWSLDAFFVKRFSWWTGDFFLNKNGFWYDGSIINVYKSPWNLPFSKHIFLDFLFQGTQ